MIPSRLIWDGRTLSRVLPPLGPAIERYGSAVWPGGSFSVGAA